VQRYAKISSWGTFISGLAAAIGLIFSGSAIYYAADTAAKQDESERRKQASKINLWMGFTKGTYTPSYAMVSNQSESPAYSLIVYVHYSLEYTVTKGSNKEQKSTYYRVGIDLEAVRPCTAIRIDIEDLAGERAEQLRRGGATSVTKPHVFKYTGADATFTDASGVRWQRGTGGQYSRPGADGKIDLYDQLPYLSEYQGPKYKYMPAYENLQSIFPEREEEPAEYCEGEKEKKT
jgi:hypothetical protein